MRDPAPRVARPDAVRYVGERCGGKGQRLEQASFADSGHKMPSRTQRTLPGKAAKQHRPSAESLPQPPGGIVGQVGQHQVQRSGKDVPEHAHGGTVDARATCHHELGAHGGAERAPSDRQASGLDSEKSDDIAAAAHVDQGACLLVVQRTPEERNVEIRLQVARATAFRVGENLLVQRDHVRDIVSSQWPNRVAGAAARRCRYWHPRTIVHWARSLGHRNARLKATRRGKCALRKGLTRHWTTWTIRKTSWRLNTTTRRWSRTVCDQWRL